MNIYDEAHKLAKAIKDSAEYREFVEKQKKVYANPSTREMAEDFKKKAMEFQIAKMSGKEIDNKKMEEIKKLEGILMKDPLLSGYFMSEMRLSQIMNDVYKILGETLEEINIGIDSNKE